VRALLDVNVLIALAWPNHSHHDSAHSWFAEWTAGWATTPLTETGFVRVSSNTAVLATAVRPVDALASLAKLRALPAHTFWVDSVEGVVGNELAAERVLGHRQVADVHLVAIAMAHDGTVATFDKGMRSLVTEHHADHVTVIPA
jgi:toxin-antitoxin system PIN domain toxin